MSTQPIPVFDPQGILRDVPYEQLPAAVKAGGMPAVKFLAPDKTTRFVPANRMQDAYKAGGTVQPFAEQDVKHPGFWATLLDDAKGMATSAYHAVTDPDPMADPDVPDSVKNALVAKQEVDAARKIAQRKAQGYGALYSEISAPANEMLGVNVAGMEKSAAEGDQGGVMGHAAAVPASMVASDLAGRAFSTRLTKALAIPPEAISEGKSVAAAKTAAPSAPPDATAENVDFAGEKRKPAPWNAHDATGENKPFAGGVDEAREKAVAKTAAAKTETPVPAPMRPPSVRPQAADAPQASAIPESTVKKSAGRPIPAAAKSSGDPILDRLREISANIKAKGAAAEPTTEPTLEDDLMAQLKKSLEPENLARFKARKLATQ
ncbi:MAG: hypothetical protein ACRD20_20425 [Terriglobales bacterium]